MSRPNIGARGVQARRRMGWFTLTLGVLLAAWLTLSATPAWAVTGLIPIFLAAGLGLFQARHRT